jgi:hypothetical protein
VKKNEVIIDCFLVLSYRNSYHGMFSMITSCHVISCVLFAQTKTRATFASGSGNVASVNYVHVPKQAVFQYVVFSGLLCKGLPNNWYPHWFLPREQEALDVCLQKVHALLAANVVMDFPERILSVGFLPCVDVWDARV